MLAALSEVEGKGKPPAMPAGAILKEEGAVPPMPPDAFVKVEVVVKEEEGSASRPKRGGEERSDRAICVSTATAAAVRVDWRC